MLFEACTLARKHAAKYAEAGLNSDDESSAHGLRTYYCACRNKRTIETDFYEELTETYGVTSKKHLILIVDKLEQVYSYNYITITT